MSRLGILAHYDPHGLVAPHVGRQLRDLATVCEHVIMVTTSPLTAASRHQVTEVAELIERDNFGHDFAGWKMALDGSTASDADEIILTNDSYVGPVRPFATIVEEMETEAVDVWGFTISQRRSRHIQSFLLAFRPWVVQSRVFRSFWARMRPARDRSDAIARQEVGLSTQLLAAGFELGAVFTPSPDEQALGARRQRWWAERRVEVGTYEDPGRTRDMFAVEPPNPAAAYADSVLGGHMPMLKFDVLRYDPYWLDADRLLSACERVHPLHFDGVREFLDRTAPFYPDRPFETDRTLVLPDGQNSIAYGR